MSFRGPPARLFVFLIVVWSAVAVQAAELAFPPLTGRVVDEASLLSPPGETRLDAMLAAHEQATGQQVVVATVASLQGTDIADYGYRLGRAWGIGERDKDTGAILLVAPNERAVRIEVGYGLEGTLTDAVSRIIIEREILPSFRAGRMEDGVIAGATAILSVLRGEAPPRAAAPMEDPGSLPVGFIIFIIVMLLLARGRRRRGMMAGLAPLILSSGGRRSGGGFGGGFGGFRGGGGSFGGGGASGRW